MQLKVLVPAENCDADAALLVKFPPRFNVPAPLKLMFPLEFIVREPVIENVPVVKLMVEEPFAFPVAAPTPVTLPWTVMLRSFALIVCCTELADCVIARSPVIVRDPELPVTIVRVEAAVLPYVNDLIVTAPVVEVIEG